MSVINTKVKPFANQAFKDGRFLEITDRTILGKWSAFVFYPADFTLICPTELEDLADHQQEFQRLGAEIYGVSTDTHFSHKAWHAISPEIKKCQFALIGDPSGTLTNNFEALDAEAGLAVRGTFAVNPEGVIKFYEVHDSRIPRDAADLIRKLKIAQYAAAHPAEACPARWQEGDKTLSIAEWENRL